jgi:hypothetical protein
MARWEGDERLVVQVQKWMAASRMTFCRVLFDGSTSSEMYSTFRRDKVAIWRLGEAKGTRWGCANQKRTTPNNPNCPPIYRHLGKTRRGGNILRYIEDGQSPQALQAVWCAGRTLLHSYA